MTEENIVNFSDSLKIMKMNQYLFLIAAHQTCSSTRMTKGNSISLGTPYGNFIRGNNDKLMISYSRERSHDYNMEAACSVLFEGEIHFFGGGFVKD